MKYSPLDRSLVHQYNRHRFSGPRPYLCYSPFTSLFFAVGGGVYSCCQNPEPLGCYPQNTIWEIWNGRHNQLLRAAVAHDDLSGGCAKCASHIKNGNFGAVVAQAYDRLPVNDRYPTSLYFELHNTCNLECIMCFGELSSSIRKNRDHLPPMATPYDAAFVEQLVEFIPHLKTTSFFGGEPFLIGLYEEIWNRLIAINPACEIVVQTNGTVLSEKVKRLLERGNFNLGVSLDSIEKETYQRIRVGARFEKVMENVAYFQEYSVRRGKPLRLAVCVMTHNWREIPSYLDFADRLGALVYFNTVWTPQELSLWHLGPEILKEVYELYDAHAFRGDSLTQKINGRNLRGYSSLLRSWRRFMQFLEDHGVDFRTATPEHWSGSLKRLLEREPGLLREAETVSPFPVELVKILDTAKPLEVYRG